MDFALSARAEDVCGRMWDFMREHVFPAEPVYEGQIDLQWQMTVAECEERSPEAAPAVHPVTAFEQAQAGIAERLGCLAPRSVLALAVGTVILVSRVNIPLVVQHGPTSILGVWRALPSTFRKLLASDVFIRTSEGLVEQDLSPKELVAQGFPADGDGELSIVVAKPVGSWMPFSGT